MIDLNASTAVTVSNDLKLDSDSAEIGFGADNDTRLIHTDGSGLTLNGNNKLMFNDASQFIQGSSGTVLSLGATDEIDLTATALDLNGTVAISGNTTIEDGADLITATAGTDNVRIGEGAGDSITSGGNYNVTIGKDAGTAITTGDYNTVVGTAALDADTLGGRSTALGYAALSTQNFTTATDSNNTAVGF